jgi:hypothetical protein
MGVGAAIGAIGEAIGGFLAADVGVGAGLAAGIGTTVGTGLVGAGIGALGGGALSAIEGKPILKGALSGAEAGGLTGLGVGAGGALGAAAGIGSTAGGILGGAAGGALGGAATGSSPLLGAAGGAISGGVAGLSAGASGPAGTAPAAGAGGAVGGPGVGAVGTAAPASVGAEADATLGATAGGGTPNLSGAGAGGGSSTGTVGAALAASDPGAIGGAVPQGTEMAPVDAAAVQNSTAAAAAGGTNTVNLATTGNSTQQGPGSGVTMQDVNTFPVPPQSPMVDPATGNAAVDASGNPVYANADQATYQSNYNTAAAGNFQNNLVSDSALSGGAAPGNSIENAFKNPSLGTIGTALSDNASWLAPVGSLGLSAAKSLSSTAPTSTALENNLQGQANTLSANSAQLQSYLQTGTLPAGVQNSINSAAKAAQASIRSQYAARGMSGSSAEAADLAAVETNASSQGSAIATQLLNTGVTEAGLADQIYGQLLQTATAQDNALSTAVGNFASSMVPRPTNLTISTQAA